MRALLVAALLGTGCSLAIDSSRHERPEPPVRPYEQVRCGDDATCPPGMFCRDPSGEPLCIPCWHAPSNGPSMSETVPGGPLDLATVYDGTVIDGEEVAFVAWATPTDGTAAGLVEMPITSGTLEPRVNASEVELLRERLGMTNVLSVALTMESPPTSGPPSRPVLAALGTIASPDGDGDDPAIWVGYLRPLDGGFIRIDGNAELLGPIALVPYFGAPSSSGAPRVSVVWRERGASPPPHLNSYVVATALQWSETASDNVNDRGDFFLRSAGGRAVIFGSAAGEVIGVLDLGDPRSLHQRTIDTPGRTGPAAIASIDDSTSAFAWPIGGPNARIGELRCDDDGGCERVPSIDMLIFREGTIGPIAMTASNVGPLLFLEHVRRQDPRMVRISALALRADDDYRPGYIRGSGVGAELFFGTAGRETISVSVHTDADGSEWGGIIAAHIAGGRSPVVEVHTMLGCGTSPEDITSGL